MLKKFLTLSALICMAGAARATVTIVAEGLTPNLVLSSSGTALADGDLVRIGYFSSTATLGTSNSLASLNSIFKAIGEGNSDGDTLNESGVTGDTIEINNYGGTPGAFYGEFDNVSASYLQGDQLSMWVFNATTESAATQWGIFTSTGWEFPPDLSEVSVSLSSANISVLRGSNDGSDFELANIPASVPEPASFEAMTGAIAIGALALRRRKR
jgi:hypothetical protein